MSFAMAAPVMKRSPKSIMIT
ncbi:UNVERIFIED_CONTAM: hypothetical protein GTU68_001604 [Idotea baltica]|nr:hypothetical protein [Idotea baltica]